MSGPIAARLAVLQPTENFALSEKQQFALRASRELIAKLGGMWASAADLLGPEINTGRVIAAIDALSAAQAIFEDALKLGAKAVSQTCAETPAAARDTPGT